MRELIAPALRARLRHLRIGSRARATGDGVGQHVSAQRGAGLEFAQYRAYEPGDEPRRIDWKLYARSDRFFVREAERDSPLLVWIVLDSTASMRQSDAARPTLRKLDAAASLAACVVELAVRQGDRIGIIVLGGQGSTVIAAGSGARQRDRCLLALSQVEPAGTWPDADTVRPCWQRIAAGAIVLMLSDFFDEASIGFAEGLARARREVLGVQLLGADERDFPFTGGHRLRDPETNAERRVEAGAVRDDFLARFAAARAALHARCLAHGIRHVEYMLDEALIAPLEFLFAQRQSR